MDAQNYLNSLTKKEPSKNHSSTLSPVNRLSPRSPSRESTDISCSLDLKLDIPPPIDRNENVMHRSPEKKKSLVENLDHTFVNNAEIGTENSVDVIHANLIHSVSTDNANHIVKDVNQPPQHGLCRKNIDNTEDKIEENKSDNNKDTTIPDIGVDSAFVEPTATTSSQMINSDTEFSKSFSGDSTQTFYTTSAIDEDHSLSTRRLSGESSNVSSTLRELTRPKYWGPPRAIELTRSAATGGLGISIVGGTMDMKNCGDQENTMNGIFVKNVSDQGAAFACGEIHVGDRIVSVVNGVDLKTSTHEEAVSIIKNATNPVHLIVQSLFSVSEGMATPSPNDPLSRVAFVSDSIENYKLSQNILRTFKVSKPFKEWLNVDGRRLSDLASAITLAKDEEDYEPEDRFGYTLEKIQRKYSDLEGEIRLVSLNKVESHIGLGLAGDKDRSKFSVFVVGIEPNSAAALCQDDIHIGDQLIEVNGVSVFGRSHLIASCLLANLSDGFIKLVFIRKPNAVDDMAIRPECEVVSKIKLSEELPQLPNGCSNPITEPPEVELLPDITLAPLTIEPCTNAKSPTNRRVKIKKGSNGFGITLTKGKTEDTQGFFVTHVSPNSPASQEKRIKVGDQVLAIDDQCLTDDIYSKLAEIIKCNEEIELTLKACSLVPSPKSVFLKQKRPLSNNSSTLHAIEAENGAEISSEKSKSIKQNDFRTALIVPDCPCTIEIDKGGKGLGLSIVGGSDTVLSAVFVHEVYPDGSAAKDGRLQSWDQILEVQDKPVTDVPHHSAIQMLRQAPSTVKLLVYRNSNFKSKMSESNQIYDVFAVELVKKPGRGLGLNVVGRKEEPGIFVSEVIKNSVADVDNRIKPGDQILDVNGQNLTSTIHEQAASILKSCTGKITLKLGRWKLDGEVPVSFRNNNISNNNNNNGHMKTMPFSTPPFKKRILPVNVLHSSEKNLLKSTQFKTLTKSTSFNFPQTVNSKNLNKENVNASSLALTSRGDCMEKSMKLLELQNIGGDGCQTPNDVFDDDEIITVEIVKIANKPLGMGIGTRPRGVVITCVTPDTPVFNKLKVGDKVIAVNSRSIVDQHSAVQMIKNSGPSVVFTLSRLKSDLLTFA